MNLNTFNPDTACLIGEFRYAKWKDNDLLYLSPDCIITKFVTNMQAKFKKIYPFYSFFNETPTVYISGDHNMKKNFFPNELNGKQIRINFSSIQIYKNNIEMEFNFVQPLRVSYKISSSFTLTGVWYSSENRVNFNELQYEIFRIIAEEFINLNSNPNKNAQATPNPAQKEITDNNMCVVCMTNKKNVYLDTCGHVCMCEGCSVNTASCPLCRAAIGTKKPAYI